MVQFILDKENKIPLYLQLKDQIKYHVSTGSIKSQEQLPPVKLLAQKLGINFLTVRKAYKELENEGLVNIKHGEGSFISLHKSRERETKNGNHTARPGAVNLSMQFADEAKKVIDLYLQQGLEIAEVRQSVEKALIELERDRAAPNVVFAECNQFQIKQISELLEKHLNLEVKPFLIADLEKELSSLLADGKRLNIVTTGFHVNEVRRIVGDLPVQIDVLITNLNPETRRKLESVGQKGRYGFICRDQESVMLYKDLLKAELGFKQLNLTSCTIAQEIEVRSILETVDVILASPPVFEEVKKLTSKQQIVFNLFERVDPMSLKVVKDNILGID